MTAIQGIGFIVVRYFWDTRSSEVVTGSALIAVQGFGVERAIG
jgi:hypothetical protein